jgi:hypothetical protein
MPVLKQKPSDTAGIAVKVVYTLAVASRPMGLGEISKTTKCSKSLILYHLRQLLENHVVLKDGTKYICQPFLTNKGEKDDLSALMGVMVSLLTKELVIDDSMTVETLGECVIKNLEMFLQLYKEGLFS